MAALKRQSAEPSDLASAAPHHPGLHGSSVAIHAEPNLEEAMRAQSAGLQEVVGAPDMTKDEAHRLPADHNARTRQDEEDWR